MIRILNTKQIRELDAYTIEKEGIPSIDLMERACRAFVTWFVPKIDATKTIGVVCGTGNNGGDGLGIARLLQDWGYRIKIWVVRNNAPESPDFKTNLDRIKDTVEIVEIKSECDPKLFSGCDVMIDAIFGSGLSRPVAGVYANVIRCLNETQCTRIAVDIPSGLSADGPSGDNVVRAHYTVTFQLPKLSFFLPQSYPYTGDWTTVDIGLSKDFIKKSETSNYLITQKDVKKIIRPRSRFDHKGRFGHALLVCGSYGKMGAAVLASRAALRAGAGLVTAHVPECGYNILQTALPEAMASIDSNQKMITDLIDTEKFSTIGIGPGIGQAPDTVKAFGQLLKSFKKPVVLDADAINILSAHPDLQNHIPENSILTPHPKEFERLAGQWAEDFERMEKQKQLAKKLKSVVILKGAFTSIATPGGHLYFNPTGNPGMAKGGSGDVLTGIITGLLSQQYNPIEASILGVYWHGHAGDLAAVEKGVCSLLSSDLVEILPQSYKALSN